MWGSLRGRAFAGIGSSSSGHKIVSLKFDAELVAIDEAYATIDNKVSEHTCTCDISNSNPSFCFFLWRVCVCIHCILWVAPGCGHLEARPFHHHLLQERLLMFHFRIKSKAMCSQFLRISDFACSGFEGLLPLGINGIS